MATKYQRITDLYESTILTITNTPPHGRHFCARPAATTNAALTNKS